MISKLKLFEKYLNLLLIFLFPVQLALHFWPNFAFVFGIRIDYLSPTIYLTDVIFILLFVTWLIKSKFEILKDINKNRSFLLIFLAVIILNLAFSSLFWVSCIKWIKIIELIALGYYFKKRTDVFTIKNIAGVLFYSVCIFSFIGLVQFFRGRTLGNLLYFLGERTFSIFTPGIALVSLFGRNFLRAYSTFPHPNSFAGFLGATFIFLILNYFRGNKAYTTAGCLLMLFAFLLTFSLSAYIALIVCVFLFIYLNRFIFSRKIYGLSIIFIFLASFAFVVFSKPLLDSNISYTQSVRERLVLGNVSGKMFSENWFTGSGLNTFILNEVSYGGFENGIWLLQPVHNIYLLIFTETGVLGIGLLGLLLYKLLSNMIKTKNRWGVLIMTLVLITGLFDHYWFTIQQNLLLLSLFFGISFREKI